MPFDWWWWPQVLDFRLDLSNLDLGQELLLLLLQMAVTFKIARWDDQSWDTGNIYNINVNDTFNVSTIDQNNRVVTLVPLTSAYTSSLLADTWDDATFWWDGTLSSVITVGKTFTVQTVDTNNRTVWLNG